MALASGSLAQASFASQILALFLVFSACHRPFALVFISVHVVKGSAHMVLRTPSGSFSRKMALAKSSAVASLVNEMMLSATLLGISSSNVGSSMARWILSTVENLKAWISRDFNSSYELSSGGFSMRSKTPLIVSELRATTARLNWDFLLVMRLALKLASAILNHASGLSAKNEGSFTEIVPILASSGISSCLHLPFSFSGWKRSIGNETGFVNIWTDSLYLKELTFFGVCRPTHRSSAPRRRYSMRVRSRRSGHHWSGNHTRWILWKTWDIYFRAKRRKTNKQRSARPNWKDIEKKHADVQLPRETATKVYFFWMFHMS